MNPDVRPKNYLDRLLNLYDEQNIATWRIRMYRLLNATDNSPCKLRMSRDLRKAVRDLKRYALEEEKRLSALRNTSQNPAINKAWGL